jgi:hypothetical protein
MVLEAYGRTFFKSDRPMTVKDDERSGRPSSGKTSESVKKFENSSTKTVPEQSVSWQIPLGSVMEFAKRS